MRYRAPARGTVDPAVFERMPLAAWSAFAPWLRGRDWPSLEALNAALPADARERFVAQTPALLADGLHYETRIAASGAIATRPAHWHDLFNALVWLRHGPLKRALNRRQAAGVARQGPAVRSRAQCAMTHFDEAGVVVRLADPALLPSWDGHDWHGLFWRHRDAWVDGRLQVVVVGHALLEHALAGGQWLVGKALVVAGAPDEPAAVARVVGAVEAGEVLCDPQELRPLPLNGLPGWDPRGGSEAFHRGAPAYRPLRPGRRYPPPLAG